MESAKAAYRLRQKTIVTTIFFKHVYVLTFIYLQQKDGESELKNLQLRAGNYIKKPINITVFGGRNRLRALFTAFRIWRIPINEVGDDINTKLKYEAYVDDQYVWWGVGYRTKYMRKHTKVYYAPISARRYGDQAVHLRRTMDGNLVLVRRELMPVENTLKFRILESNIVSFVFYIITGLVKTISPIKVSVFYEKFAEKAEEGAYDLFKLAQQKSKGRQYFVIDGDSLDYKEIVGAGVVKKYSLMYYWAVYRANSYIGTEVPTHLSILRSNNHFLRRRIYLRPFVFLQHGIIYMKNLGVTSAFIRKREGEPDYIVASSKKERNIIERDLQIPKNRILVTGLGQFSKISYNTINQESDDIVTIMLTWKNYDENFKDFTESSYYQNVIEVLESVKKVIPIENIRVVAHPKVKYSLSKTEFSKSLWNKSVSEALDGTKLLITDYSSVCYNVFYRGAAVIFYQPDLKRYEEENGKLIPARNEYIGRRIFNINKLLDILNTSIIDGSINLSKLRTKKHIEIYKTINEFNDGKNIKRIYNRLRYKKLI